MTLRSFLVVSALLLAVSIPLSASADNFPGITLLAPNGDESIARFGIRHPLACTGVSAASFTCTCQWTVGVRGRKSPPCPCTVQQEYRWTVPDTPAAQARINKMECVVLRGSPFVDTSDGDFTIRRPLFPTPLIAPTDLDAVGIGTNSIRLTWNDNSVGETELSSEREKPGG